MTHRYTLLVGGSVIPAVGGPAATAIAWAGDTVIAVGSDADIRGLSRGDSLVVDLLGATVIPLGDGADVRWPIDAVLDIGGPANLAILEQDPRGTGTRDSSALSVLAIIRGGRVVDGRLPGGQEGGVDTSQRPASLGLVILATDELERSRSFYVSAFGWPIEVDTSVYVEFRLPAGMRLGLYEREAYGRNVGEVPRQIPIGTLAATELYLYPDDLDAAIERLTASGSRLLSPRALRSWGDEVAYFADPDGNVLALARRPQD